MGRARQRFYQFTAIDEATRFRVLRVYDANNTRSASGFFGQLRGHLPFAIRGSRPTTTLPLPAVHLASSGSGHRAPPDAARPKVNREVERSHKTDEEEFYRGRRFRNRKDLVRKLKQWEREYNEHRPHLALSGKTPAERVLELARTSHPIRNPS